MPRDTSLEAMAKLPTLRPGGTLTAALASQISDGASAVLVASEAAVKAHHLTPRARIHHLSVRGADPIFMLSAPIPATEYALRKTGMRIDDFDAFEVNEAFASVVLAWIAETGADPDRVNVNGGASRSDIRWVRRVRSCSPPCCTNSNARVDDSVCRRCARAAEPRTS